MFQHRFLVLVPLALTLPLGGCKEGGGEAAGPINPTTNAQTTSAYAGDIFKQLGGGLQFVTADDGMLRKLLGRAGAESTPAPQPAIPDPLPRPVMDLLHRSPGLRRMRPSPIVHLATMEEDFDDTAKDLEILLRDRLLADANIEAQTATEVTYLLRPDPTCRPLPSQQDATAPALDPDCAADLAKLEIRIVATKHGDGGRFQVLVGPQRHELSVFIIHSDEVTWQVGLASAKKAGDYIDGALGEAMSGTTFRTLTGRLQTSLKKLGEDRVAFTASVLEAVEVDPTDGDASFRMAKSDPAFRVTADGPNRTATLELDVGQVDVKTNWDPKGTGAENRDLQVSVGGLRGKTTLTEASKQVSFEGIGLGATSVMVRGTKIFALDFNPNDGRKMDLLVKLLAGDVPRFEVTPRFDLSLMFNLAAVAGDFKQPPEAAIADETYTVALGGATPAAVELLPADEATGFDGGVKIAAGKLTVSAKTAPAETVTVGAGQCLIARPMPASGAHPVLGGWQAGACM